MSNQGESDPRLIARIRDVNDASAWNQFTRLYKPLVSGFCRKRGLQESDADDVAQNVFVAIARAMPSFRYDASRGSFRAWLIKVTRSKLANYFHEHVRREASICSSSLVDQPHFDERAAIERNESLYFKWCLFDRAKAEIQPEFRPTTWSAFWLTAMQGFTAEDVAQHLGISVQAVYIAKSRVLKRFRERVRELVDRG